MTDSKPLSRSLAIMDVVSQHPSGATMMEIVERLQLPKSSTYRLVKSLVDEGYLQGQGRYSRYRLGRRFIRQYHNSALTRHLLQIVRPILRQLCALLDEVVYLNTLVGREIRAVTAEFPRSITARTMILPGDNFPVHASASGKVLCAFQESALRKQLIAECNFEPFRPNTITNPAQIEEEFATVRERGYATIEDELDENVFAVAVPIEMDGAGVIYSLALVGPQQEILRHHTANELIRALRQAASEISQVLASSRLDTPGG